MLTGELAQAIGEVDEQLIAGGVAELVVDRLEVIDIEVNHGGAVVVGE